MNIHKILLTFLSVGIISTITMFGCSQPVSNNQNENMNEFIKNVEKIEEDIKPDIKKQNGESDISTAEKIEIDLETVKPNETGRIMVLMFHNFVESFNPTKYDDGTYTTTFEAFEKNLFMLYEKDYRLISMEDYLNNNISVEAGKIPMIFTFDDGTTGQFNLVEKDGELIANPNSAVGIMEKFNQKYPDFGLRGVFYLNLGNGFFGNGGSEKERLEYLIKKGFEIGNHTYTHINLASAKSIAKIQEEVGKNQKVMGEIIPGYELKTLSLPYGAHSKDFESYVIKGSYEGVNYNNMALMEVGAEPAKSPVVKGFNPVSTYRIRATGMKNEPFESNWYADNTSRSSQYVSDGDKDKITVPKEKEELINMEAMKGKELIIY